MNELCFFSLFEFNRKKIKEHISKVTDLCLDFLQNPEHHYKVEKAVADRARKQVNAVLKFGQKCLDTIQNINAKRVVRAPIQSQLDAVLNEIEALEKTKKPVPPELQTQADELRKKLSNLPEWPHFSDLLNYHEYDDLIFNVVSKMILAALDSQKLLEDKVKLQSESIDETLPKMTPEQIEAERQMIKQQIDKIVSVCLLNVQDPGQDFWVLDFVEGIYW